ncbi:LCP family protein [Brachybacterium sp. p3-SID957]|uniref:LCP family protein n=1 Tax=Brachybacterium sp. p3-SID957 TaxID=2916049 RepID=UPI00223B6668|nr:LCP family protein [Brachybacterium sp. p3-SID957]MCT1774841.1 LCP family protein [Brachybacterium sp. p3-SID957]
MTDPSSSSWRRRRRGGKHQAPGRRSSPSPLSPDAARANREAAFGSTRKAWVGTPSTANASPDPVAAPDPAASPDPAAAPDPAPPSGTAAEAARPGPTTPTPAPTPVPGSEAPRHGRRAARPLAESPASSDRAARETEDHDAWSSPVAEASFAGDASPAAHASTAARPPRDRDGSRASRPPSSPQSPSSSGRHGARAAERPEGSLPTVAFWTVLTSVAPGSGLLTTSLRRIGWVLLGIMAVGALAVGAWLLLGDPTRSGLMLLTDRTVLVGLMIAVALVGLVWAIQIVVANLAHTSRQRLQGAKRYLAFAIAALMVVAVALPFGRGVQSLWAAQGLLGSDTVFGQGNGSGRIQKGKDPWAGVGRINILLLGQDAGDDRTGTRPDTIMVASVDTESGHTALFSIPRNLEHVRFPEDTPAAEVFPDGFRYFGRNQDLINAVWRWAEDRPDLFPGDPEPGLTATTWAVEETLGLEMDYYAMVNLQGFEDLVDAIGGVDLVVERRIPIGGGSGPIDGYIEPGDQKLDGYHALWYARSREGSDDFNRMCRQQRIVRAVAEEADPATVAMSVPRLVTATEKNIATDIPVRDLDAFVELALRIKEAGFTSYPITQDVTPSGDPDWDYLKAWAQASIEDSMKQSQPESVKGETEAGSTDPAPTGEAPSEEGTDGTGEESPEESPTEEPTEDPTSQESTDGAEPTEEPTTENPEIEQDPLQSCLPGAGEEG